MDFSPKNIHYHNQKLEGNRFPLTSPKSKSTYQRKLTNLSIFVRQSLLTDGDRTLKLSNNNSDFKHLPIAEKTSVTAFKHHSICLNRPILKSEFHPKSYSYHSLIDNNKNRQSKWIKRYKSNSAIEELLHREKNSTDVTV